MEDKDKTLVRAYNSVFSSELGSVVLDDLLHRGHIFEPTHTPDDVNETAYQEGQRQIVLYILTRLKAYEIHREHRMTLVDLWSWIISLGEKNE